jgi:hypothetical protein
LVSVANDVVEKQEEQKPAEVQQAPKEQEEVKQKKNKRVERKKIKPKGDTKIATFVNFLVIFLPMIALVFLARYDNLVGNVLGLLFAFIYSYMTSITTKNDAHFSFLLLFGNSIYCTVFGWHAIYYSYWPWEGFAYAIFLVASAGIAFAQLEIYHQEEDAPIDINILNNILDDRFNKKGVTTADMSDPGAAHFLSSWLSVFGALLVTFAMHLHTYNDEYLQKLVVSTTNNWQLIVGTLILYIFADWFVMTKKLMSVKVRLLKPGEQLSHSLHLLLQLHIFPKKPQYYQFSLLLLMGCYLLGK